MADPSKNKSGSSSLRKTPSSPDFPSLSTSIPLPTGINMTASSSSSHAQRQLQASSSSAMPINISNTSTKISSAKPPSSSASAALNIPSATSTSATNINSASSNNTNSNTNSNNVRQLPLKMPLPLPDLKPIPIPPRPTSGLRVMFADEPSPSPRMMSLTTPSPSPPPPSASPKTHSAFDVNVSATASGIGQSAISFSEYVASELNDDGSRFRLSFLPHNHYIPSPLPPPSPSTGLNLNNPPLSKVFPLPSSSQQQPSKSTNNNTLTPSPPPPLPSSSQSQSQSQSQQDRLPQHASTSHSTTFAELQRPQSSFFSQTQSLVVPTFDGDPFESGDLLPSSTVDSATATTGLTRSETVPNLASDFFVSPDEHHPARLSDGQVRDPDDMDKVSASPSGEESIEAQRRQARIAWMRLDCLQLDEVGKVSERCMTRAELLQEARAAGPYPFSSPAVLELLPEELQQQQQQRQEQQQQQHVKQNESDEQQQKDTKDSDNQQPSNDDDEDEDEEITDYDNSINHSNSTEEKVKERQQKQQQEEEQQQPQQDDKAQSNVSMLYNMLASTTLPAESRRAIHKTLRDYLRNSLQMRDIRQVDPAFAAKPALWVRHTAIVVSLDGLRALILFNKMFVFEPACEESQHLISIASKCVTRMTPEGDQPQPFEFDALEGLLIFVAMRLEREFAQFTPFADRYLEKVPNKLSSKMLEELRRRKQELKQLMSRANAVKSILENLLDDDEEMANMYLTEKHSTNQAAPRDTEDHSEVEILLEAYLQVIDEIVNHAELMDHQIDDTEGLVQIHLDTLRNHLLTVELSLSIITMMCTFGSVISGVFGMNFKLGLDEANRSSATFWTVFAIILVVIMLPSWLILSFLRQRFLSDQSDDDI